MPTECAESGCPNQTDSGLCTECAAEQKYGTTSRNYDADGSRVELRDGETRDDDSHAGVVAAQLAEADAEDLEELDEDDRELVTDGGVNESGDTERLDQKKEGVWPDQSRLDHSWSQFGQTKSATASPSETYFATRSPSLSSQFGHQDSIRQLSISPSSQVSLRPNCIGVPFRNDHPKLTRTVHSTIRNSSLPHEHASRPIGRIRSFLRIRAAYADPHFSQVTSTRPSSVRDLTLVINIRTRIFKPYIGDLEILSAVRIGIERSVDTDTDGSEATQ